MRYCMIVRQFFVCVILLVCSTGIIHSQTAVAPSGDGTAGNPYQIATLENLYWFSVTPDEWGKQFIQTADINASGCASWNGGQGFSPIGLSGSYDGQNYFISNIRIDRTGENNQGLFGTLTGSVSNLIVTDIYVSGGDYTGGLAGHCFGGTIMNCYVSGTILGNQRLGVLVGYSQERPGKVSNIYNCFTSGSVGNGSGGYGGGLVGYQDFNCTISNSFSKSAANTGVWTGGLVGMNFGTIINSYSAGSVMGSTFPGGLVGGNSGNVSNSFWDKETSNLATSEGGTGLTTAEMKNLSTFINAGWDFTGESTNGTVDYWSINPGLNNGYPILNWILTQPINHNFGEQYIYTATSKVITVYNSLSTNPLEITSIQLPNSVYTISPENATIQPNGRQNFLITFTPVAFVNYTGNITFNTNVGNITFRVYGEGIPLGAQSNAVNCLSFDGVDDFISIPDNDDGLTAFTFETWVKWQPGSPTDVQFICGKNTNQMELHTSGGTNNLRFIPTDGVFLDAVNVLPVDTWTHIACVYDPSQSLAKMYVNGVEVQLTNNGGNPLNTPLQSTATQFRIGRRSNDNYAFKGQIDEFRLWNTVRTPAQIRSSYGSLVGNEAGLKGYWRMDEGSGAITNDYSANGFSGTLMNSPVWIIPSTAPVRTPVFS